MLNHLDLDAEIVCIFVNLSVIKVSYSQKVLFFFFFCDPNDFTLLRIEDHKPFTLPGFESGKV